MSKISSVMKRIHKILDLYKSKEKVYRNEKFPAKNKFLTDIQELLNYSNYREQDKRHIHNLICRIVFLMKYNLNELKYLSPEDYKSYSNIKFIKKLDEHIIEEKKEDSIFSNKTELNKNDKKLAKKIYERSIDITKLNNLLNYKDPTYENIDNSVYKSITTGLTRRALYTNTNFINIRRIIVFKIFEYLSEFTKHDTEVKKEDLTDTEVIQALNTSIAKFIELHYQQPKELKKVLMQYTDTPIATHTEIVKDMITNSDDTLMLTKIFTTYKKDIQNRIYNYDLFAFLYYEYSLFVSFEYLYNSQLLEILGAYKYVKDKPKPLIKKEAITVLERHKEAIIFSEYDINIYIENLFRFISEVNTKKYNQYLLSFLVDMSHNLKLSKDFMQSLTNTRNKNITYKDLPIPVNTLLLAPQQIAN